VVIRRLLPVLLLGAALALSGCGNKLDVRTVGETEGLYIDVGDLKYQIQLSRIINPRDTEDQHYLTGLPAGTLEPNADEAWFGVWIRAQNTTSEQSFDTAQDFEIVDTQENTFEPIELEENEWAYMPRRLGPNTVLPDSQEPAGQGPVQGSLILFKLTNEALQNRPLEFKIKNPTNPDDVGIVDLDV
jgi:hypothetical protein